MSSRKFQYIFGSSLLPDTFVSGETEPTLQNVGLSIPEINLQNYAGNLIAANGQTYENLAITGNINLASGVSANFKNCYVKLGPSPYPPSTPGASWNGIDGTHDNTGKISYFDFCKIFPSDPSADNNAAKGGGWVLRRCLLGGTVDGLQPHGSGTAGTPFKITKLIDSMVYDLRIYDEPRQNDGITHNDACQAQGKVDLEVTGCALYGGRTSCFLIQQGTGTYTRVFIDKNWLYGYDTLGSTVNIPDATDGSPVNNLTLTNNRVRRTVKSPRILIGVATRAAGSTLIDNNTYMDDGSLVPISNAG